MADLQRVPAPRVPFGGRGELATAGLLLIVLVLMLKPWAEAVPLPAGSGALPTASAGGATPAPPLIETGYRYDQRVFGPFEPNPEWSVWPGGFFVNVLYVTREAEEPPTAPPAATPSLEPSASPTATTQPNPGASPGITSDWPATVTIGPGDHLLWLGLNTPVEWTVRDVDVWLALEGGGRAAVPAVELPSTWGPHFTIIGIPVVAGSDRLAIWPMGTYDVEATLDPDGSRRTIRVEIQTLDPQPTATPDGLPH